LVDARRHLVQFCFDLVQHRVGLDVGSSCQPKVADLDVTKLINQKVGWLHVSVHHSRAMHEVDSAQLIVEYGDDVVFSQIVLWIRVKEFFEIRLHEFKDQK